MSDDELGLLLVHRGTVFTFDPRGRMIHENDPRRSRGKRFSMTGSRTGNLAVLRDDVSQTACREITELLSVEPPLFAPEATPRGLERYLSVLGRSDAPGDEGLFGYLWVFPEALTLSADAELVTSGTSAGSRLLDHFEEVMPESLQRLGFRLPDDLWAPWCIATVGGRIASIAQTVRVGPGGAEVGVVSDEGHRGRGFAAAACAGWSRHPQLAGSSLFYSTNRANASSRRVAERLGLRFVGSTFAVP